jgi:hypothetical protein
VTLKDIQLLIDLHYCRLSSNDVLDQFSVDLTNDIDFIRTEIKVAMESGDPFRLDMTLQLIWFLPDITSLVDLFNQLLIMPGHKYHQEIARRLQFKAPIPTTVPYVRKVFESDFEYLAYTGSDSPAITSWFSHLLAAIGNAEAINLIRELSHSTDEGVAEGMRYRLKRLGLLMDN